MPSPYIRVESPCFPPLAFAKPDAAYFSTAKACREVSGIRLGDKTVPLSQEGENPFTWKLRCVFGCRYFGMVAFVDCGTYLHFCGLPDRGGRCVSAVQIAARRQRASERALLHSPLPPAELLHLLTSSQHPEDAIG